MCNHFHSVIDEKWKLEETCGPATGELVISKWILDNNGRRKSRMNEIRNFHFVFEL